MIQSLLQILGNYTPVTTTRQFVETIDGVDVYSTASVVADGLAGVDWPWVCSAAILLVMLYSAFRFLGGMFR